MHIYIWNDVENLTTSYHSDGGLNIIASSLERAREMWKERYPTLNCDCLSTEPDYELNLHNEESYEEVIIRSPNAGCC